MRTAAPYPMKVAVGTVGGRTTEHALFASAAPKTLDCTSHRPRPGAGLFHHVRTEVCIHGCANYICCSYSATPPAGITVAVNPPTRVTADCPSGDDRRFRGAVNFFILVGAISTGAWYYNKRKRERVRAACSLSSGAPLPPVSFESSQPPRLPSNRAGPSSSRLCPRTQFQRQQMAQQPAQQQMAQQPVIQGQIVHATAVPGPAQATAVPTAQARPLGV